MSVFHCELPYWAHTCKLPSTCCISSHDILAQLHLASGSFSSYLFNVEDAKLDTHGLFLADFPIWFSRERVKKRPKRFTLASVQIQPALYVGTHAMYQEVQRLVRKD